VSGAPPAVSAAVVVGTVVADAFRQEQGRITAALIHQTGDWDLAGECAQDAFAQALRHWPRDGVPNRPRPWLMTVARNGAIDRLLSMLRASRLSEMYALGMLTLSAEAAGTGDRVGAGPASGPPPQPQMPGLPENPAGEHDPAGRRAEQDHGAHQVPGAEVRWPGGGGAHRLRDQQRAADAKRADADQRDGERGDARDLGGQQRRRRPLGRGPVLAAAVRALVRACGHRAG
jgi:DNA-directed RNA polymerase specialized sigma24 family protein